MNGDTYGCGGTETCTKYSRLKILRIDKITSFLWFFDTMDRIPHLRGNVKLCGILSYCDGVSEVFGTVVKQCIGVEVTVGVDGLIH